MFLLALRMLLLSAQFYYLKSEAGSLLLGNGSVIIWLLCITKGMPPHPLEVYCRLDLDPNFWRRMVDYSVYVALIEKVYESSR